MTIEISDVYGHEVQAAHHEDDLAYPSEGLLPAGLDRPARAAEIDELFLVLLGRETEDENYKREQVDAGRTLREMIAQIVYSTEFALRFKPPANMLDCSSFRAPRQLAVTLAQPRKILLVGSCALDPMYDRLLRREPATQFEQITFNNGSSLPPLTRDQADRIDFQILQLPIRAVMPEHMYLNDQFSEESSKAWFAVSERLLTENFRAATVYARDHGVQTLVMNFLEPQQNPLGRLQDPYSFRNSIHYVRELNHSLYRLVSEQPNAFMIDADQIAAAIGRRYVQDDSVVHLNHGSTLNDLGMEGDEQRIEPIGFVPAIYSEQVSEYNFAVYDEAVAAWRSIRQIDSVKLVIFDLDDTLWRGVAAERPDSLNFGMTEGWPLGIVEAASYLMKRGILIALVSKNDEDTANRIWEELYGGRFPIDRFVAREINWLDKADNVAKIIVRVNVRPEAVLFVDDNPVERARVRAALPGIRVMDAALAEWRRILMWSAELQPAVITDEAKTRASTIEAMAKRQKIETDGDPDFFRKHLGVKVELILVDDVADARFARCFELINKTNQFNTTGRRWIEAELHGFFADGGYLLAFGVQDRFANYGVAAAAICQGDAIVQYVMSCRVFGMQVEHAAMAMIAREFRRRGEERITATYVDTSRNHLAARLFVDAGFAPLDAGGWAIATTERIEAPDYVEVVDRPA